MAAKNAFYEINQSDDGLYYWHLKGANGEIVASSETFTREHNAYKSVIRMQQLATTTDVRRPFQDVPVKVTLTTKALSFFKS